MAIDMTQIFLPLNHLVEGHCERVIFPGGRFLSKANDNCELEIERQTNIGFIKDTIPYLQLKRL